MNIVEKPVPTIYEVSRLTGVLPATVSRVINGSVAVLVSERRRP
jgi:DNA-binding LacI/PurR family transcriptional regulator